ncbi:hypothetical protein M513_13500, partial [Trichuris suis]
MVRRVMRNHCKLTLPYKNSLTNEAASVGVTMVLLCLLTLSLLVQSAIQESRERRNERKAFRQIAQTFFARTLAPINVLKLRLLEYDRCPHKDNSPYGLGKFRLRVTCPNPDPSYCGLYGTRRDGSEVMVVECQFAAELTHRGKEIAALCYQNTTTGGRGSRG